MKDSRDEILSFWFEETAPAQWFQVSLEFDETIKRRFLDHYGLAAQGIYDDWIHSVDGALALVILFDQFPRNMFRGSAQQFATDSKALQIAELAIERGFDQLLPPVKRRFLYLPFEHSEKLSDQQRSVALFETMRDDDPLGVEYAERHLKVIEEFGRFPHRNAALGRVNTPAEDAYLKAGKTF